LHFYIESGFDWQGFGSGSAFDPYRSTLDPHFWILWIRIRIFLVLGPDPHFDPDVKIFFCFFLVRKINFLKKSSTGFGSANILSPGSGSGFA